MSGFCAQVWPPLRLAGKERTAEASAGCGQIYSAAIPVPEAEGSLHTPVGLFTHLYPILLAEWQIARPWTYTVAFGT